MSTRLADELKQTRAFATLEQEAHIALQRTAAVLAHGVGETLKPHGLTATQYNVLRILRGAGEAGLCRNEVRDRMIAQVPDVTRLLDRMEEMGLIARERDTEDRRYVTTRITADGRRTLAALDAPVAECHARHLGHLGADRLRTLIELLAEVRDGVPGCEG